MLPVVVVVALACIGLWAWSLLRSEVPGEREDEQDE